MKRSAAWLAVGLLALACGKYGPPVRPHPPEPTPQPPAQAPDEAQP